MKALIVVDVQNDFVTGSLTVPGAKEILGKIAKLVGQFDTKRLPVIFTMDNHPDNHSSFTPYGGPWPPHCVAGTKGSQFALTPPLSAWIVTKGNEQKRDAYSGFENKNLEDILKEHQVDEVVICGLATDYCVRATALDSIKRGFKTIVRTDCIAGVDKTTAFDALEEMHKAGVKLEEE